LWFVWHFIDFLTFLSLYLGSGLHRNCCILTFLSHKSRQGSPIDDNLAKKTDESMGHPRDAGQY